MSVAVQVAGVRCDVCGYMSTAYKVCPFSVDNGGRMPGALGILYIREVGQKGAARRFREALARVAVHYERSLTEVHSYDAAPIGLDRETVLG